MAMRQVTVCLPEQVAEEAEGIGLFQPGAMERLVREAIQRRKKTSLAEIMDRLANVDLPPMTESEVEEEIQAARAERRAADARHR